MSLMLSIKGELSKDSFQWQHDTNPEELEAFFGLLLGMGLVRLPQISHYWSRGILFGNRFFQRVMSGRRFNAISRWFKVSLLVRHIAIMLTSLSYSVKDEQVCAAKASGRSMLTRRS